MVMASRTAGKDASVAKCSLSQDKVNFIVSIHSKAAGIGVQSQMTQATPQVIVLSAPQPN